MQRAKSLKILLLSFIFGLSVILGFSLMNKVSAKAADMGSKYFNYVQSGHSQSDIKLENDLAVIPMKNGDVVEISNKLAIDDFGIKLSIPENAKSLELIAKTDAYYVTGNKSVDGTTFEKQVEISLLFEVEGNVLYATYNGGSRLSLGVFTPGDFVTVALKLDSNYLLASVNEIPLTAQSAVYYKVKNLDKVIADVGFEVKTADGFNEDVNLEIEYIDQKASQTSGEYKQTFVLNDGVIATHAYPRISLNDSFFARKESSEDILIKDGEIYTITPEIYNVTGHYDSGNVKLVATGFESNVWIGDGTSTKKISFNMDSVSDMSFFIVDSEGTKIFEQYDVKVVALENDKNAPVYINDVDALESFNAALEENLKTEYDVDGVKEEHFISIGDSKYFEIPSMENLVKDDLCSYDNLSYTVNYKNLTESSTNSSMKVPVKFAGEYEFYVVFSDKSGNEMKAEDFYKMDDDGVTPIYGIYEEFVFGFEIEDDAPMFIKVSEQGEGYKGVEYTASSFTITASAYTLSYRLYYSAQDIKASDDGWVEILSNIDVNAGKTSDYFTKEELQKIDYDGSLTFTPDRLGYYKIVCEVNSSNSERSVSESVIINVQSEPKVVKPDNKWLQNNVWSVVFLSIGSVCLIAIIVLLCIKPKTETSEVEETGKKPKVKRVKKNKK